MTAHYFAYGSNLCVARLQHRVPGARLIGTGELRDHELCWHKRSTDGSGKCSIRAKLESTVLGAVFEIPPQQRYRLDLVEGLGKGYDQAEVLVSASDGPIHAWTYVAASTHVDDKLQPFLWYRDLVAAGTEALGLPSEYTAGIRAVRAESDRDSRRAGQNRSFIPCGGAV